MLPDGQSVITPESVGAPGPSRDIRKPLFSRLSIRIDGADGAPSIIFTYDVFAIAHSAEFKEGLTGEEGSGGSRIWCLML